MSSSPLPALPNLPEAPKASAALAAQLLPQPQSLLPLPPGETAIDLSGQLPVLPPARPPASRPAALVGAAPPKEVEEKSFIIPGLQSREYTDQELLLAFEMIDLDGHGKLGPSDLHRALGLSGEIDASDAEVSEMIRLTDPNGTGFVSFEEFVKAFKDPPPLFRNFDVQRREMRVEAPPQVLLGTALPVLEDGERNSMEGTGSRRLRDDRPEREAAVDPRTEAVTAIMGKGKAPTPQFIRKVYQKFVEVDVKDRGLISFEAFCQVFRKSASDVAVRKAFDIFDVDQTSELDLQTFVVSLSMFTKSRAKDKLRFAFMMFDEEESSALSRHVLASMLRAIAPHVRALEWEDHISRLYAMHSLHPHAEVSFEELAFYMSEHEHLLEPVGAETLSSKSETPDARTPAD